MFRRLRLAVMTMLGTSLALAVQAQSAAPSPAAASAEARAQQQADKVFTWIRLHAEKPQAKRNTPAAEPAANSNAGAQAKAVAKPASKPTSTASTSAIAATPPTVPADAAAAIAAVLPSGSDTMSSVQRQQPPQELEVAPATTATPNEKTVLAAASLAVPKPGVHAPVAPEPEPEPEPAPLKLLHKVDPEVPRQLQRDFRGGSVKLRFTVKADGSVEQAEAVNASNKRLASAAVAALTQWRFAPIEAPRVASVEIGFQVE
ncbi:TonB family protein [Roseateles sp.]|uniref:energy transducer TonB n=1 Tax=Roseateles sp. TaxID=1971397 RepID=UPI003BA70DE6